MHLGNFTCLAWAISRAIKNPLKIRGGFVHRWVRIRSLTMTYFHRRVAYYHWRGSVSPSCSGWEGVVPLCYGRQTKGWGSSVVVLNPHSDCLGCCRSWDLQPTALCHAGFHRRVWKKVLGCHCIAYTHCMLLKIIGSSLTGN